MRVVRLQTLQVDDTWFWKQGLPVRTLAELIKVYHATVGANSILELDFAIDNRVGGTAVWAIFGQGSSPPGCSA